MTRKHSRQNRSATADESQHSVFPRFWQDTRGGAASQIDFANAMIILLFGVIFFFGASTILLAGMADSGPGDQLTSWRVSEKITGDIFVHNTTENVASQNCVDAFFAGDSTSPTTPDCQHDDTWDNGGTEQEYLRNSLAISSHQRVAVVLIDTDGNVEHRIGGNPPVDNIGKYQRHLPVEVADDTYEWFTLEVYVW